MKQYKKRIFGILLSFALMLTMMPVLGLSQTAYADADTWSANKSFDSDASFESGVDVTNNITITIAEGKTVRVEKGIYASGKTLTVEGKGNLIVSGSNSPYGSGGSAFTGSIIVKDGNVTLTGGAGNPNGDNDTGGNGIDEGNVEVLGGSFSATGGNGHTVGRAVSNTITCENGIVAQGSADGSEWSGISGTSSDKQYVRTIQTYPLWVGGTQVNIANAGDILGNQTASYVAGSNTLTLNGATITKGLNFDDESDSEFGIYYNGSEPLIIDLADGSVNTVKIDWGADNEFGIYVGDQNEHHPGLNISGKGKLTVYGSDYGIHAPYITIDECDVTASGGRGIHSYSDVIINAGSKVTAFGDYQAIKCDDGYVKNAIAGTGWTNKEGDEGETPIPISTEGQTLTFKKVQFPAAHTHIFTYTASGDTITATCSAEGCPLPPSTTGGSDHVATLTIAAPEHTTYGDGNDAAAQITDANSIKGDAKVQYQKKTGESTYDTATETAPTDAGTYKASITLGTGNNSATASVEYTIAKANPTVNAPSGLTTTYGKTLADVTLSNPSGNTEGTWAWVEAGTTSVGNVGTQTHKANFTPTDNANYNSVSNVDVSVTVNKAANPATVSSTASVKKGGNTVELADNVTTNGATGAISYAISGENKGCTLDANGKLTSGTTTGTVTVNVSITADDNYEALAATPITVTITEKDAQDITADDVTATYGDADKKVSATTTGDGSISYAVKEGSTDYIEVNGTTGELTIIKVPADGKADVTVTAAETKTYAPATRDVTVNINKKSVTVKANDKSIKVGEAVPDLSKPALDTDYTVSGLVGTDKLKADPKLAYASQPDNTKVGSYAIEASNADAGDNYAISYEKGTLTISEKAAPTPTPKASAPKVTTTAKASAMTMTVKWTMKWGKVTGAKNYKVAYRKVGSKKWTYKNTKKTSYVVKGHKMKGLYEYKVGAVSKAGTTWSVTSRRYFSGVKANAKAAKGAIKASWKKDKGATGYQVFVATNKKMNNSKVYNVSSSAKSYKVNGLKKGKTYYVRVRPMKKADGVTYKGIQSKIHKVKVK